MTLQAYSSFAQWYSEGRLSTYVRTMKSAGGALSMLEVEQPAGDVSDPAVPDLVLHQDLLGGSRISGDVGGGRFNARSEKGNFLLARPNFANAIMMETSHRVRSVSFPVAQWQDKLDEAVDARFLFDFQDLHRGWFAAPAIWSALRQLWALCDEQGIPSRLLAQAAGCEILAELCRLVGAPLAPVKGGLAPWAERRSLELMRVRLSEDISLDELAVEARLSPFHFARMFKQSVGVPPRVHLTRLRVEKACELLERTDLPVTEIALEVGYSSNQVLARVFMKHRRMSPSDYRRAVRDPARSSVSFRPLSALEGRE
ncbi:helix-turn-helix domain-containing protein [Tabrizicola sp.]|uniref:helix-turn-helix domain-containing protein n=1 Tax=Tabrizicola sp. TaxID=2005166 RepID=UPI003F2CBCDF